MQLSPVITFGEWLPDVPPLGSKYLTEVVNAVSVNGAYGPVKELEVSGPIGPGVPSAAIAGSKVYVAFPDGLYCHSDTEFTKIINATGDWSFERWGKLILAHSGAKLYQIDGLVPAEIVGAPAAGIIKRAKHFLFAGALSGNESFIQWSAFNDVTKWSVSKTLQSDLNDMGVEYGNVMGIIGDETPFILQERSISRADYAGPPVVFSFPRISDHKGCVSKGSVIDTPFGGAFFSQDGPNVIVGGEIRQAAKGGFEKWFEKNFDSAYKVTAGYNWTDKLVFWTWNNGTEQVGLSYSFTDDKISKIVGAAAVYFNGIGDEVLGLDQQGRVGSFTGVNAAATFITGELQLEPQKRSFVSEIWPIVDSAIKLASAGTRKELSTQIVIYTPSNYSNVDGMVPCRSSARAHRFKVEIPRAQEWQHAQGVQIGFRPEGRR